MKIFSQENEPAPEVWVRSEAVRMAMVFVKLDFNLLSRVGL
jgi:hypothetical protein